MQSTAQAPAKTSLNLFDIAFPSPSRPMRSVQGIFTRHRRLASGNLRRASSKLAGRWHETMQAYLPTQPDRSSVPCLFETCRRSSYRLRNHARRPPKSTTFCRKLAITDLGIARIKKAAAPSAAARDSRLVGWLEEGYRTISGSSAAALSRISTAKAREASSASGVKAACASASRTAQPGSCVWVQSRNRQPPAASTI